MNPIRTVLGAAVAACCCASLAQANPVTDTFDVTATVVAACIVDASDLSFGNYNPVAGSAVDATSTISVTCTNGSGYSIGLSAGGSTDEGARAMAHASDPGETLAYGLFRNAGLTENWGGLDLDDRVTGTGTGSSQQHTVYGRVFASQSTALVGSYSDTITASVYF